MLGYSCSKVQAVGNQLRGTSTGPPVPCWTAMLQGVGPCARASRQQKHSAATASDQELRLRVRLRRLPAFAAMAGVRPKLAATPRSKCLSQGLSARLPLAGARRRARASRAASTARASRHRHGMDVVRRQLGVESIPTQVYKDPNACRCTTVHMHGALRAPQHNHTCAPAPLHIQSHYMHAAASP